MSADIDVGDDNALDGFSGNGDFNRGSDTFMIAGVQWAIGVKVIYQRPIMEFDLSSLSADAITKAELHLNVVGRGGSSTQIRVTRQTRADWVEGESTWTDYKASTAWTAAGGDVDDTDKVEVDIPGSSGEWTIDITDLAVDAVDNRSDILNILMRTVDETIESSQYATFHSGEGATVPFVRIFQGGLPERGFQRGVLRGAMRGV